MKSLRFLIFIKLFFILLIFSVRRANGLKIFGVFPLGSRSHFSIGKSIIDSLHDVGHDITVLSPFPLKKHKERYRDIDISHLTERFEDENEPNAFAFGKIPVFVMSPFMATMAYQVVDLVFNDDKIKEFMESQEKFDICIIELFFSESFLGFADHFDCVLIGYTTYNAVGVLDEMTGNISPSSYVPMPLLDYTDKMAFIDRFWNTLYTQYEKLIFHTIQLPLNRYLYRKYFPNSQHSLDALMKDIAIIFQNSHVSIASPRPFLPKVIEICGIHVKPAEPLPNDLQSFLDTAEDGVIVFTMGSFVNSKDFPVEVRNAFVNVFRKLKQKVIWKYEEDLPNKSENIKISSWLPQRDILAHKNVKVFITHGGLLGITEAIYEGIPLLGIPIFADQKMNMMRAVSHGYALQVNYDNITEEEISSALDKLLNDNKYMEMAKTISKRFIDRPMTPKESVVYWTEYAYRYNGTQHLTAAAIDLNYIQFHSLDVYGLLSVIIIVIVYIAYKISKVILGKLMRKCVGKQKKN